MRKERESSMDNENLMALLARINTLEVKMQERDKERQGVSTQETTS